MNKIKFILLGVFIFALFACEQPFKAGLGPVVDTRPPTITLTSPSAGSFINGVTTFRGTAEDDYRLKSAWIKVINYPDKELNYCKGYVPVSLSAQGNYYDWTFRINTTEFPDGDIKIQLKVLDTVNKVMETDPYLFVINNSQVLIKVVNPDVDDMQLRNGKLNWETIDTLPNSGSYPRQVNKGSSLSGTISHAEDIYTGERNAATNRYPPQIRLWKIEGTPVPGESWAPGVMPSETAVPWVDLSERRGTLMTLPQGNYQIVYPLGDAGSFYGFELRAQTYNGRVHLRYPRDTCDIYNPPPAPRDWNSNGDFEKENRYVLFFVSTPRETPRIELWGLEDFLNPDAWSDVNKTYANIPANKYPYPLADKVTVEKVESFTNGGFVLRLKTTHSEGISSAEVYWTKKDDETKRGRFIWDMANVAPVEDPGLSADRMVPAGESYSRWGYEDPKSSTGGFYQTRSFIFTYAHGSSLTIPNNTSVNEQVRGRSKVQGLRTGAAPNNAWNSRGEGALPSMTQTQANTIWQDMTELEEGWYNIEVFTRSRNGTPYNKVFQDLVLLDRTGPRVSVNGINGTDDYKQPPDATTVNGVISPMVEIYDDLRSANSDVRGTNEPYFNVSKREQRYMVIKEADKVAFDNLNRNNWWPTPPAPPFTDNWTIPSTSLVALKHGEVANGTLKFKTSEIYKGTRYSTAYPTPLPDGFTLDGSDLTVPDTNTHLPDGTYYLYVFARDNAFNVGHTSIKFVVDHLTDFPVLDFSVGSFTTDVTKPDFKFDFQDGGFRYYINGTSASGGIGVRNRMGPQTAISLTMRDDDSLDLGTTTENSSVIVKLAGSKDNNGTITALEEVTLAQEDIKTIFGTQGTSRGVVKMTPVINISQAALLKALKTSHDYDDAIAGLSGNTSLPDGIYRISISVADYTGTTIKLLDGGTTPASAARNTVQFWFAKDTIAPVVEEVLPASGGSISFTPTVVGEFGYGTGRSKAIIKGKVSDQNGPMTGRVAGVRRATGNATQTVLASRVINPSNPEDEIQDNFTAEIVLNTNIQSDTYIFTLEFRDRFDTLKSIDLRYTFDTERPTVAINTKIKTFSRHGVINDYPGLQNDTRPDTDLNPKNASVLTNGVVSFEFNAKDNQKVREARWWMVPDGAAYKPADFEGYDIQGITENVTQSLTITIAGSPIKIKYGRTTTAFTGKTWYVNTNELDEGRYVLYAAAEDDANNLTGTNTSPIIELQQVYILQDEDMPWFGEVPNITPNTGSAQGVIGASGAIVRGSIFEDDGFFTANGNDVLAGSVKIYMSKAEGADAIKTHGNFVNGPWPGVYGYTSAVEVPTSALTRAGGSSNINIQYDLRTAPTFADVLSGDGLKHYVIEARDSWVGKFTVDNTANGTPATGPIDVASKIRRYYFSFEYDSKDPVITIVKPDSGASFGTDSNSNSSLSPFKLTATISDAHLDKLANGNYYISWALNNSGTYANFDLGIKGDEQTSSNASVTDIVNTVSGGVRSITFTISASVFTSLFNYTGLASGNHALSLQVKDESNKIGVAPLSFLKDTVPPTISFNTINGLPLPSVTVGTTPTAWWSVATNAAGYLAKRTALNNMPTKLTVLQHEEGSDVTIRGSFVDTHSNIANSFEYSIDNTGTWTTVNMGTVNTKNVDWQIDIPAASVPDGVHSISIRASDVGGNVTNNPAVYYGFIVVSKKPVVAITAKGNDVQGDNKTTGATVAAGNTVFIVSGTAASASLDYVKLKISFTDDPNIPAWTYNLTTFTAITYPASNLVPYIETGTWTYTVTRANMYTAGGNTALDTDLKSGNYELSAVSVDKSGLESDEYLWTFIVDRDKPVFKFTTPSFNDANGTRAPSYWLTNSGEPTVIMSTEPKIQINLSDDNKIVAAQYQIRRYDYATNAWTGYYDGSSGTALTLTGTAAQIEEASWRTITPASGTNFGTDFAWALDIKALPDGYYYVRIRAKDESIIYNNTSTAWTNAGNGNPLTSEYGYFFLSREPTQLTNMNEDKTSFSSKVINGNVLDFSINVKDANWFEKLEVEVTSQTGTPYSGTITLPNPNYQYSGNSANGWTPVVRIEFPTTLADGMYKITFKTTNLASRLYSISRTITLDNTAPTGSVESPATMNVGSAYRAANPYLEALNAGPGTTIYGGEAEAILSGSNDDQGLNGSASGVAEIWYHLGYVGNAANNTPTGTLTFPTEDAIARTVLGNANMIPNNATGKDLGGTTNNALFDTAARNNATAWFKYESGFPVPHGVDSLTGVVDKINWQLVIKRNLATSTEIANYTKANFLLKGAGATQFNRANGPWLVKEIDGTNLPTAIKKTGLFSMPLWVRVADTAGNVRYYCRDIWLYPNGDYPSNTFSRPSEPKPQTEPEGGQFSILGDASDNISVKKVIYRIKADNVQTSNANWKTVIPADDKIVYLTGADVPSEEFTSIPDYTTTNNNPFTSRYSRNGWYYATMETGAAPTVSWSVIVNAQNEITTGVFSRPSTENRYFEISGVKYTRLYIEVFTFDGNDAGATNFNKISLGLAGVPATPSPDVMVLYMTSSAPNIDNLKISKKDGSFDGISGNEFTPANFDDYSSTATQNERLRSRRFAVRMDLDSGSTTRNLAQISARHYEKGTAAPAWKEVWKTGDGYTNRTLPGDDMGIHLNGADASKITMTYAFDSLVNNAAANYAAINGGGWKDTGGTYVVEVRIQDGASPPGTASTRYEIGIDNFAPVAHATTVTNTKVAGSNVDFFGRAFDYGLANGAPNSEATPSYRSIESVYAWFTRDISGTSNYINLNYVGGNTADAVKLNVATGSRPALQGRSATVAINASNNVTGIVVTAVGTGPSVVSYPTEAGYFKKLSAEEGGDLSKRIIWQPNNKNNADIYWSFVANTTNMPDGWMYLNYLVIDDAGNAALYQQRMMVRNNYPEITGITLFTDNRGEGAAFTQGEQNDPNSSMDFIVKNGTGTGIYQALDAGKDLGYLNSGFISKNQAIGFEVRTAKGNGNLNYRVRYVNKKSVTLTTAILKAMTAAARTGTFNTSIIGSINLYTLEDKGGITNAEWNALGVKEGNPLPGNHFVCSTLDDASIDAMNVTGAKVWCYTMPGATLLKEHLNTGATGSATNLRFFKSQAGGDGGGDYFDVNGTDSSKIPERFGSQPGVADPKAPNNSAETAYFIIKVWDSVSSTNSADIPPAELALFKEDDQLYDVVVVGMNVFLNDRTQPTIRLYDLNPYTETAVYANNITADNQSRTMMNAADPTAIGENILRGGLFNVNTNQAWVKSGYIDPRNNSTALKPYVTGSTQKDADGIKAGDTVGTDTGRDKVSGRIILRGQAWDDQLISEIRVLISATAPTTSDIATAEAILKLLPVHKTTGAVNYTYNGTDAITSDYEKKLVWPKNPATAGNPPIRAWTVEDMHWKTGHSVEWAYIWDTEVNTLGTVYVTVMVKDANGTGGGLFNGYPTDATPTKNTNPIPIESENNPNGIFHNQISVEIVPYVVGFERQTAYNNTRSRQGWYSFYQGELGINLLGYNLGGTAPTMAIQHAPDATVDNSTTITVSTVGAASSFKPRSYTFAMPVNAQSGRINVTAAGTSVYNHTSNSARSWNKENYTSTAGSALWINRPHAHIWRTQQTAPGDNSTPFTYIGVVGNSDSLSKPSMALEYTGNDAGRLTGVWAIYGTGYSYYARNGNGGRTQFYSTNNNGEPTLASDVSFLNGGTNNGVIVTSHELDGAPTLNAHIFNATYGLDSTTTGTRVTTLSYSAPTQRWQNTRVTRSGNRYHITSYDAQNRNLRYYNPNRLQDNGITIDGNAPTANIGGITASANAGLYSAIDYDNYGPLVAYYDSTNDALRFARAANDDPAANNWTRSYIGSANSGWGQYVSIKVDAGGVIHLAFFSSKDQTIMYTSAPARANGTAAVDFATPIAVDKVIKGGTLTDISVDNYGNPMIVYGEIARIGNYDGARMAYRNTSGSATDSGVKFTDTDTGAGWEAVTLPSNYKVKNDRLNIEAWPPAVRGGVTLGTRPTGDTWNAAIGYAGADTTGTNTFRIGYFFYPKYKGY